MPGPVTKGYSVLMASPPSLSPPLRCVDIVLRIPKAHILKLFNDVRYIKTN